jgi:hypothetical protein
MHDPAMTDALGAQSCVGGVNKEFDAGAQDFSRIVSASDSAASRDQTW